MPLGSVIEFKAVNVLILGNSGGVNGGESVRGLSIFVWSIGFSSLIVVCILE